jgi:hypothetical protein
MCCHTQQDCIVKIPVNSRVSGLSNYVYCLELVISVLCSYNVLKI